jgi:hypothetical protein
MNNKRKMKKKKSQSISKNNRKIKVLAGTSAIKICRKWPKDLTCPFKTV